MILIFILSRLRRPARFAWTPSLDLSDHQVLAALIPHTNY